MGGVSTLASLDAFVLWAWAGASTLLGTVLAVSLVVVSIFSPLFASVVQRSVLGGLDQGLGFFFGVLRGLLLVAVALVIYDRIVVGGGVPMVDDSRTAVIFNNAKSSLNSQMPSDAPGWRK